MVPFIDPLESFQKGDGLEESRSFPEGFGFVPEDAACALSLGLRGGKGRAPFIDCLGFVPEGRWPGGRPVVPLRDLGSFPKLLHAFLL